MNWTQTIITAATISGSLPVILILLFRLYKNPSFLALLVYYVIGLANNFIMQNLLPLPREAKRIIAFSYNFLDAPLILSFLLFFTTSWRLIKQVRWVIITFILIEILTLAFFGFTNLSITAITGASLALNLFYCIYFFFKLIDHSVKKGEGIAKTLMVVSLLFAYCCFIFIFLLHYIFRISNAADVLLVFYIINLVSTIIMSIGILMIRGKIIPPEDVHTIPFSNEKSIFNNSTLACKPLS